MLPESHSLFASPHAPKLQLRKKKHFPSCHVLAEGWCCILFDRDDDSDSRDVPTEEVRTPCGLLPAPSPSAFRGLCSMKGDSKRTGFSLAQGMCFFPPIIYPCQFVSSALLSALSIAP